MPSFLSKITNWTLNNVTVANAAAVSVPGNYIIIVDSNNCADTAQVIFNQLPAPALGADLQLNVCANVATNLNQLYATANLFSNWTLNGNTVTNPTVVDSSGTYELVAAS